MEGYIGNCTTAAAKLYGRGQYDMGETVSMVALLKNQP